MKRIKWIDDVSIDYLAISISVKNTSITTLTNKSDHQKLKECLFDHFKIVQSDQVKSYWKDIYEKNGLNIVFENSRTVLGFKAEFFFKNKAYLIILTFIEKLKGLFLEYFVNRIDLKKHFTGKNPNLFFTDIKKGYWIKGASRSSYYQPELFRKSDMNSRACYFKSENFFITVYSKSDQIEEIIKKLKSLKSEKSKKYYQNVVSNFNHHINKKNKTDLKIYRAEIRLIGKKECEYMTLLLNSKLSESLFITKSLDCFYKNHSLINRKKQESVIYKSFFF